jgi:hypothetical protein
MADIIVDAKTKVWLLPAVANIAAPTTTELNNGTSIEGLMTPDGLIGFEPTTADVDNSALNSSFDTLLPGRASFSGTAVRLKKQSGVDAVYNAYPRDIVVYVAIRRGTLSTIAWATNDKVEIYPAQTGEPRNLAPAANEVQKYEIPLKITSTPNTRATVA